MRVLLQSCEPRTLRFAETLPTRSGPSCLDVLQCLVPERKPPHVTTATSVRRCSARSISTSPAAPSGRVGPRGLCRPASRCCCSGPRAGRTVKSTRHPDCAGCPHRPGPPRTFAIFHVDSVGRPAPRFHGPSGGLRWSTVRKHSPCVRWVPLLVSRSSISLMNGFGCRS